MRNTRNRARVALGSLVLLTAGTLGACGESETEPDQSGGGAEVCVEVGTEDCIEVKEPIKMAYFAFGLGTSWGAANAEEVKSYAKSKGVDVTLFDPAFDANKQFQQIQTALSSKQYNAAAVVAIDNNLVCNAMTKTAPSQGIVVAAGPALTLASTPRPGL